MFHRDLIEYNTVSDTEVTLLDYILITWKLKARDTITTGKYTQKVFHSFHNDLKDTGIEKNLFLFV